MAAPTDIEALRTENTRLIKLLEHHGIAWRLTENADVAPDPIRFIKAEHSPISTAEKIHIFRKLFRGRSDIYPLFAVIRLGIFVYRGLPPR